MFCFQLLPHPNERVTRVVDRLPLELPIFPCRIAREGTAPALDVPRTKAQENASNGTFAKALHSLLGVHETLQRASRYNSSGQGKASVLLA